MHTHRMGLNPFLTFYIDTMLNFDGDVDADTNANVKCEHTIIPFVRHTKLDKFRCVLTVACLKHDFLPCGVGSDCFGLISSSFALSFS